MAVESGTLPDAVHLISHLGCSTSSRIMVLMISHWGCNNIRIMQDLVMCHHGKYDVTLKVQQLGPSDVYHSLAKKGPCAVHITLCSDRGVGGYL